MIENKNYILFDLDGTLTDPKVGICTCVQYALKAYGIEEPDIDKLTPFIGPPLKDSFMEFYGFDEEQAVAAIETYRERFSTVGKFENEVYAGIPELLKDLKSYGYQLAVASSKPECFVKDILHHFDIAQYFDVVVGSELDGGRVDKDEVIHEALNRLFHYRAFKKDRVVMVGDRRFDVEGAKEMEITSVGVAYGYGAPEELEAAGPDYLVHTVEELRALFIDEDELRLKEEAAERARVEAEKEPAIVQPSAATRASGDGRAKKTNPMQMVWRFLFPFLLFYFAGEFLRQAVGMLLMFLAERSDAVFHMIFVAEDSNAEAWAISGNGTAIIQILALIGVFFVLYKLGHGKDNLEKGKRPEVPFRAADLIGWLASSLMVAMGVNMLFMSMGWLGSSTSYQEVSENLYAVPVLAGILLYGIYSPLVEELLFRGIIMNEVKAFMKPGMAIALSSALFGIYHGNMVQMVYSLILGVLLGYAYHYTGRFAVPVVLHGVVNLCVFLASTYGFFTGDQTQLILGIALIAAGAVLFILMNRYYGKLDKIRENTKGAVTN